MIANDHKIYQISIKYTKWLVPVEYIGIRFLPSSFKKMNSGLQRLRLQDLGPLLRNGVYQAQGHRGLEAAGGDPGRCYDPNFSTFGKSFLSKIFAKTFEIIFCKYIAKYLRIYFRQNFYTCPCCKRIHMPMYLMLTRHLFPKEG
jgi:hypothetical protein